MKGGPDLNLKIAFLIFLVIGLQSVNQKSMSKALYLWASRLSFGCAASSWACECVIGAAFAYWNV